MHRVSRKVVLAAVAALALATLVAPAGAHSGKGGGKKALGTVTSFDGTTLTVTTADGDVTATVTEDTKVKVEHRGHFAKGNGKSRGNPSRGDADDLTDGTFVLDMKVDDEDNLVRIRVRSAAPQEGEPAETPEPTETPDPEETETPDTEDEDTEDTEDEDTDTETPTP